jgi:hypothetical protein
MSESEPPKPPKSYSWDDRRLPGCATAVLFVVALILLVVSFNQFEMILNM